MPATAGFLRAKAVEEAIQSRAPIRPGDSADQPRFVRDHSPLSQLAHGLPSFPTDAADPLVACLSLDAGRIALVDARRTLGWTPGTLLDVSTSGGLITVVAVSDATTNTIRVGTDGRVLLGVHVRRLFDLDECSRVVVLTQQSPVGNVRIIPASTAVAALLPLLAQHSKEGTEQ